MHLEMKSHIWSLEGELLNSWYFIDSFQSST